MLALTMNHNVLGCIEQSQFLLVVLSLLLSIETGTLALPPCPTADNKLHGSALVEACHFL